MSLSDMIASAQVGVRHDDLRADADANFDTVMMIRDDVMEAAAS